MRLQKFLAMCTGLSRRKAECAIIAGDVTVNGCVAEIGACVEPGIDAVTLNGQTVSFNNIILKKAPLVLVLNKPAGCVCSHMDKYNNNTIFNYVPKEFSRKKLMFCGRLDKDTEGMVVITDSGDFAQKITHPSSGIKKHYEVVVTRRPTTQVIKMMLNGITDDGEFLKFEKIFQIGHGNMRNFVFEIVLSQGKKNEIHRVFEHFGIFVKSMKRTKIGKLTLRGISTGRCKRLVQKDIDLLLAK